MLIIYGTRFYGKVDHVPGLFYVATCFFHLWYIPLVPTGSYLMIDDGTGERGVPCSLSLKSILAGWLRAFCWIVGPILLLVALFDESKRPADQLARLRPLAAGVGLLVLSVVSCYYVKVGRDRAAHLAETAGLNPDWAHEHFDLLEGKPHAPRGAAGLDNQLLDEAVKRWNPDSRSENVR